MTDYSAFHWSEKARKYAETLGTIFNVKGRVNTVADLPATGNKIGDVYLVGLTTDTDLSEYAWLSFDNVTRWEKLGSTATSLAFSGITGSPYDNTALKTALDDKQDELPSQTGNNGKFLTTNGSTISWATVDALPSQTSQSGKFLTTNGTSASWGTIPSDSTKANTSLDNLTSTGKNIGNWSSNVSNCITEIPQDIKLELNNGTLTLKAGSKVYVPNGAGVFNAVTINSDIVCDLSLTGTEQLVLVYNQTSNSVWYQNISGPASGASNPTMTGFFYNTTDNRMYYLRSGTPDSLWFSFPIAIVTTTSAIPTSIDQIFNGFGYIGSTVFALPGVKGLIPNGRNADGTLRNTEFTISSVKTYTPSQSLTMTVSVVIDSDISIGYSGNYIYDEEKNKTFDSSSERPCCFITDCYLNNSSITTFKQKTVFHALDWNDSNVVSGWSMASKKHIDLTLGASGSGYVAPANGWVTLSKNSNNSGIQFINLYGTYSPDFMIHSNKDTVEDLKAYIPVKKGEAFYVTYTATGSTISFRFIYAEGEV